MYPIRILHVVGIMNMGGLENLIMNIYRNIDKSKIQFDFLVTREEIGIFDKEIRELGGNIYNIPHMSKVGYSKYKKIVYNFFKQHKEYKIVHCHRDALCSVYLSQAKKANIPVRIAHSHNIKLAEEKSIKGIIMAVMKKYFMLYTNSNATEYFACSEEAGRWLFGKKISGEKLKIIKNGIETGRYNYDKLINYEVRKELGIDNDTFIIGHVGRFNLQKNHKFLIEIIKKLDSEISNYKVLLVGSGSLIDSIREQISENKLENKIEILGIRNDINKIMMAFDVFAFPSLFEGLGIVLIEAQSTGLNCLVSNTVPNEANMNIGLFEPLSINIIDDWVSAIKREYLKKQEIREKRCSNILKVKENGYDILSTMEYLQKFYIKKYAEHL